MVKPKKNKKCMIYDKKNFGLRNDQIVTTNILGELIEAKKAKLIVKTKDRNGVDNEVLFSTGKQHFLETERETYKIDNGKQYQYLKKFLKNQNECNKH